MSAGGAGARAGFLVYRRGKTASAGGGVVGVPLGGRRPAGGGFSRATSERAVSWGVSPAGAGGGAGVG